MVKTEILDERSVDVVNKWSIETIVEFVERTNARYEINNGVITAITFCD